MYVIYFASCAARDLSECTKLGDLGTLALSLPIVHEDLSNASWGGVKNAVHRNFFLFFEEAAF